MPKIQVVAENADPRYVCVHAWYPTATQDIATGDNIGGSLQKYYPDVFPQAKALLKHVKDLLRTFGTEIKVSWHQNAANAPLRLTFYIRAMHSPTEHGTTAEYIEEQKALILNALNPLDSKNVGAFTGQASKMSVNSTITTALQTVNRRIAAGNASPDTFSVTIGSAAFKSDGDDEQMDHYAAGVEIARILRKIADKCEQYGPPDREQILDLNGNKVGMINVS